MRPLVLSVSVVATAFTVACKSPESGEATSALTDGDTSGPTTTINLTDITTGTTTGPTTGSPTEATTTTAPQPTTAGPGCVPLECEGEVLACGDCMDNDGDGKVDIADPECVTPCDNLEDTFATGLPGDNVDPCNQDCFFDGNSGAGNDKCEWNLKCDMANPGGEECPYDPDYKNCPEMQSEQCLSSCQVPNGCDCFGCCTVEVDGMTYDIFLGDADCSLADIDSCEQCTKNDDCDEECHPEECEICFGETEPPPGCEDPTCAGGQSCTIDMEGNSDCPEGYYCQTGCCFTVIPP
ncbi:hypothetical protein [Nannocystis sp. SCPEA4]|uniref:hypothetical protein n=1 Tax=Nannocystis sp. SCPEA4 TaxID=2996787 RepID=UPI00226ED5FF|nr:hypothetical protein [Nannocystis sp. SCPEA4]MCY1054360.1 hypothetical protein [Nannocystis sp. SCPEA4]